VLQKKRAEYGQQILPSVSARLTAEFGRGWTERNLAYMVRFADAFAEERILHTLCAKLGWSHFRLLVGMDDRLKRDFYADMCRVEGWTVRTLGKKIDSMLFERTALSRKPGKPIEQELKALRHEDRLTPDLVFRDSWRLDFLGLKNTYAEKDLEGSGIRVAACWTEALPRATGAQAPRSRRAGAPASRATVRRRPGAPVSTCERASREATVQATLMGAQPPGQP
jgi:hypothetical protein